MTDHRTDRQLNALAAAMGKALGVTKAELRKEFEKLLNDLAPVIGEAIAALRKEHGREIAALVVRIDEHQHQLAELAKRIDALERAKKGARVVDMTAVLGRRAG